MCDKPGGHHVQLESQILKSTNTPSSSGNPFADHVGFVVESDQPGHSRAQLAVAPHHLNPNRVVHGAVLYAMADTGMGFVVASTLGQGEMCATIEIKMTYFKAITDRDVVCRTVLINRGKRVAYLESSVHAGELLIAKASGTYAIFIPSRGAA
jgi:acyl-CoA thioesterase